MKKLLLVTLTSIVFISVEIMGGMWAHSIAIMSDAAHLASDVVGISVSILALFIAQKQATKQFSYGFHRVEVLGALLSIFSIWGMSIWLIIEATDRFFHPPEVVGSVMFSVAILSLVFNLI